MSTELIEGRCVISNNKPPDKCQIWAEEKTYRHFHSCHTPFTGLDGHVHQIEDFDLSKIPTLLPRSKWILKNCSPYNHKGERCKTCPVNPKKNRTK